jgi:hypothetical protein
VAGPVLGVSSGESAADPVVAVALSAGVLAALLGARLGVSGVGLLVGYGWAAHVLADALTDRGVPLLWPLWRRRARLPWGVGPSTGGTGEAVAVVAGLLACGGWIALALAALGAVAPAGPAAALGRVCPPGAPSCDPERLPRCAPGQPSCSPETVGLAPNGRPDGPPGNTSVRCPGGQSSCDPEG